jgi:hypothetical protein
MTKTIETKKPEVEKPEIKTQQASLSRMLKTKNQENQENY